MGPGNRLARTTMTNQNRKIPTLEEELELYSDLLDDAYDAYDCSDELPEPVPQSALAIGQWAQVKVNVSSWSQSTSRSSVKTGWSGTVLRAKLGPQPKIGQLLIQS